MRRDKCGKQYRFGIADKILCVCAIYSPQKNSAEEHRGGGTGKPCRHQGIDDNVVCAVKPHLPDIFFQIQRVVEMLFVCVVEILRSPAPDRAFCKRLQTSVPDDYTR